MVDIKAMGRCDCEDFSPVTHCIFDMDGLMLDTDSVYESVYKEIAEEYDKKYTIDLKLEIMGRPEIDGANIFVSELELPLTGEQFLAKFKPMCMELFQKTNFLPGIVRLVRHLKKHNIPIAVATSSNEDIAKVKISRHKEIFDAFHHIVYGSSDPEVKHGKPAPDIYLVCASRFPDKPRPDKILVFEDAPNGVQGAIDAGMQCVFVPASDLYDKLPKEEKKKATLTIRSMELFMPELFDLPSY